MRQNQKGMTLIEVIVSLLILSTASLMAFSSFSVIIRTMNEGSNIKNSSNRIVALMDGDAPAADKEGIINEIKTATAHLSLEGGTQINVQGTACKGTIQYGSDASDIVELSKFTTKTNKLTPIEQLAYDFKKEYESIVFNEGFIAGIESMPNYAEIKEKIGGPIRYDNLTLRKYLLNFYYPSIGKTTWPSFDASKFEFDTTDDGFINNFKKDLQGTYYIQPFYSKPYIMNGQVVIFARTSNDDSNSWSGIKFFFNDTDNHWYYLPPNYPYAGYSITNTNGNTLETAISNWNAVKERMVTGAPRIDIINGKEEQKNEGWVRLKEK